MNKYSYFDLVLKFIKEKNTNNFWNELNQVIKEHNDYFRKLDLTQRITISSETGISSIKDLDYKSFNELRSGIIIFKPDRKLSFDDLELLILVLKRCNVINNHYSQKYTHEQIESMETICNSQNILIVMIGNMPTDEGSILHWKKFIKNSDDSLHIVIHPNETNITNSIRALWEPLFKNKNNLMICDNEHWVKTKWGNFSLSLATIMAMEYAMKNKPYGYYKKIVFLQQCLPLYNYEVIKEEFLKDNKSWFKPRDGQYPGWQYSQPYNFNRSDNEGATIYDWNWWNAIFALDCSHLTIFFDKNQVDSNKNYIGTYKKDGKYNCYGEDFDNVIPINKGKYDVLFKQVTGSWNWNKPSMTASCINSDEVFFGLAFKHHFKGNEIVNHTRLINLDALEKLYKKNILSSYKINNPYKIKYLFDEEDKKKITEFNKNFGENNEYPELKNNKITNLDENIYIYLPRIIWLFFELYKKDMNYPLYIGIASDYNPEKLNEYYVKRYKTIDGELKNTILKNGVTEYIDYNDDWTENGIQELKIKNTDYNDPNQFTAKNIYDQSLTYHDWTSFTISPENIFRDASFTKYVNNKCDNTGKISDKFDDDILSLLEYIEKEKLRLLPNKLPIWHPSEYYTINLKKIINAYNIMSLCIICNDNQINIDSTILTGGKYENIYNIDYGYTQEETHNYFNLIKIIKYVWRRAILLFADYIDEKQDKFSNSYFTFKSDLSYDKITKLENIKLGTCLTEDILSSALVNGSLFIRKCVNGSEINIYTDALFNINSYVPNNTSDYIKYPNKKDFGEFLYIPETIFTWEFYRKKRGNICNNLNKFDVESIDQNTKINFIQNESIEINDILFKYKKILAKGTNNVVLYRSDDNKNILIKQSTKDGNLNDDINAIEELKNKKFKDKFIFNHVINNDNIILEIFDNTLNTLAADYLYKNLLSVNEYLKIIYFVIDVFNEMAKDKLYYIDLKMDNLLYKCEGVDTYKIKFGDIGSISKTTNALTFYPVKNVKAFGEKQIIWSVGVFILQMIGGTYINQKMYQKIYKEKSSDEFNKYFANIKNTCLTNIHKYFKNDNLITFINKLFGYDSDDIFTIEQMYFEMKKIYDEKDSNYKQKYLKYKQKYLQIKNKSV